MKDNRLSRLIKSDNHYAQMIRYIITGGIATALQYGLYLLFLWYCGFDVTISTIISYILSLIGNFFISSFFTFRTKPNGKKAACFVLSHISNLMLQTILTYLFSKIITESLALIPAMVICIPVNYILVRLSFTSTKIQ